jgi:hypothetical protein
MADKPRIVKTGTIVCDLVEATPIVWKGRLYRYEYVRSKYYQPNLGGEEYFRFIDIETGEASAPFAEGYVLGCAHVGGKCANSDTLFVYGTNTWGGEEVRVWWSDDMEHWETDVALHLPGWGIYNTSVCADPDGYTMAFECGEPADEVGVRFTIFFARSADLINWEPLPTEHNHTRERYAACPALRYLDGQYYMIYLEAIYDETPADWDRYMAEHPEQVSWQEYIARSPDLIEWELSPLNPVLKADDNDRILAPGAEFTAGERERIATALDVNNSDFDFCEFEGRTHIVYSWGNQHGVEHLATAVYDGPLDEFLRGWFPE